MRTGLKMAVLALLGVFAIQGQQYTISTFAGGAPPATPIAGIQASLGFPNGVTADRKGNVYFSSLNCVFKLDSNGVVTRVAGNSHAGYAGDNGSATSAHLSLPAGLAIDKNGNLYIADTGNNRIRKVSAAGTITTVAGTGLPGYSGDGGPSANAQINQPYGVAVDDNGNIYVSDYGNWRVRKVSPAGTITTIAGNGVSGYSGDGSPATDTPLGGPWGLATDPGGNLYIAERLNHRIRKVSPSGVITTVAGSGVRGYSGDGGPALSAQLAAPWGVALDASGNIFIVDTGNSRIRKVAPTGSISTIAGNGAWGFSGDGGPAVDAQLYAPSAAALDDNGNLFIADFYNNRIRKVSTAGNVTTVAGNGAYSFSGDGGPATKAQLSTPWAVAVDDSGNVYIADAGNGPTASDRIRKVSASGAISTIAGTGSQAYSGDDGPAIEAALFFPEGVAIDSVGNVYVADAANNRVRKISASGTITTIAGNGSAGYSGDGGAAASAALSFPRGVAVDDAGNLYIADYGNNRIRKVSKQGTITTVAGNGSRGYSGDGGPATLAELGGPTAVAIDAENDIYMASYTDSTVRKISAAGVITTVAGNGSVSYSGDGGPATAAALSQPYGLAIDSGGNLYIADTGNNRIRKVSPDGTIMTIAGGGPEGAYLDGVPATSAALSRPNGVAVNAAGQIFVADTGNQAVRMLTPSASVCAYSVLPTSIQSPVSGGTSTLAVSSDAGCSWTISNLPEWITLARETGGQGTATINMEIALNGGPPRSAQILVAGVAVTVSQASSLLFINSNGVVNAASYTTPVAAGSIVSIFGNFLLDAPVPARTLPLPASLGGLSFQLGGAPLAPLFYASLGQVNAQMPWEVAGQPGTTQFQTMSLATYAPGIFAQNGAGTGQGAILGPDYRLVDSASQAIAGGTWVQIYCTGLGPVTNQPATGAPAPSNPLAMTTTQPTVMIGGAPATVQFSGLVPGLVGLYQVNAQVPASASRGSAVPVLISIGGVESNVVTIAVR